MRMEKCCCFTGHRPQKLPWGSNEWDWRCVALKERILLLIRELYREGYRHFITGMALGIDTYCCEMVLRLKEETTTWCWKRRCPAGTRTGTGAGRTRSAIAAWWLSVTCRPWCRRSTARGCMLRRDRYMVSRAECVRGVYDGMSSGGTRVTLTYALEQQKEVRLIDLGDFEA